MVTPVLQGGFTEIPYVKLPLPAIYFFIAKNSIYFNSIYYMYKSKS